MKEVFQCKETIPEEKGKEQETHVEEKQRKYIT